MEYPKILFAGGWDKLDDYVLVNNKDEEDAQRANGYGEISSPEDKEDQPKRRGRPPKEAQ